MTTAKLKIKEPARSELGILDAQLHPFPAFFGLGHTS